MKPRLFISSTSEDLTEYRDEAIRAAYRMGFEVEAMEEFGPDRRAPADLCKERVEACDVLLGLYAHRYGFQPEGYGGKSMTELEYDWASDAGLDFQGFFVSEDVPWLPKHMDDGEQKERLQAFKAKMSGAHVLDTFESTENLRSKLFEHLQDVFASHAERLKAEDAEEGGARLAAASRALPSPPEPYVAHTYTLLQTAGVVGRAKELQILNDWVGSPSSDHYAARLLAVVAIGGMGKSALTWKWFQECAVEQMKPLAGRVWWSFYETDAGFRNFVASTLAYCLGMPVAEVMETIPVLEQETRLLRILDEEPHLVVLDGAERLLIAYSGMDFAHLADDELDARTANRVAGAMGLSEAQAEVMTSQHRLRTCIDPHVGNFLRRLTQVRSSRVLMTTRLFPSELQTDTGGARPGCEALMLTGLESEDAVALWREMGVSGEVEELQKLFATFDNYPLLVRALAGEVARYRPAPGNFTIWQQSNPDFDPYTLPIVQVKSHVLQHALTGLEDRQRDLLHTIAAFRSPATYDTLLGLFQRAGKEWSADDLDRELTGLEDRGLVGWSREQNSYDLHPIVRGVVWSGLGKDARHAVYGTLHTHFDAIPSGEDESGYLSLEEAAIDIEIFNSLVGLEEFGQASEYYFDRIHHRSTFSNMGVGYVKSGMMDSLFPNGYQYPPEGLDVFIYAQLSHCRQEESNFSESFNLWIHLMKRDSQFCGMNICNDYLAYWCQFLGFLKKSNNFLGKRLTIGVDALQGSILLKQLLVLGEYSRAKHFVEKQEEREAKIPERSGYERASTAAMRAELLLLEGDFEFARLNGMGVVCSEAAMELGELTTAVDELHQMLVEARANSWHEPELETRRALAEAYRREGNLAVARDVIDDFWDLANRGPYRLLLADMNNILAEVERDDGNMAAAITAAEEGYRQAWCDGPPYAYVRALRKSEALLDEFGAPYPEPPERDTSYDEIFARIPEPPADE
ncbi:MAG: DUF4062 domain-containing protein [Pseudomonadota bacterium]